MLKVSSIDCIKLKTLSGFEDKVDELEHSDDNKEKHRKIQLECKDLWDTIKRPNLQIMSIEEEDDVQGKGMRVISQAQKAK
jgi:hypothetical protein